MPKRRWHAPGPCCSGRCQRRPRAKPRLIRLAGVGARMRLPAETGGLIRSRCGRRLARTAFHTTLNPDDVRIGVYLVGWSLRPWAARIQQERLATGGTISELKYVRPRC